MIAKMVVFCGLGVGAIIAGFLSDFMGRRVAIMLFSQVLLGTGLIATVMPNIVGLIVTWFFVGRYLTRQPLWPHFKLIKSASVGVSSIAVYTVAIVWTMEMSFGIWKSILGFAFAFNWPIAR